MTTTILTIIIFSILIIVHEFGHFIAARRAGVRVEKFSIGFGPQLFKIKGKETEFLISLFPFGGYVKMAGDERGQCSGEDYEFYSKPIGVRARIVFSGPLFNILLSFFVFWMIYTFKGFTSSEPVVGETVKYEAVPKDKFSSQQLKILKEAKAAQESDENKKFIRWSADELNQQQFEQADFDQAKAKLFMQVWENSVRMTQKSEFSQSLLQELTDKGIVQEKLIFWSIEDEEDLRSKLEEADVNEIAAIINLLKKSRLPAYKAGIREDDRIIQVNGQAVSTWKEMTENIRKSDDLVNLTVSRNQGHHTLEIEPRRENGFIN